MRDFLAIAGLQVKAENEAAEQRWAQHQGRYRLLASHPDLLLGIRWPLQAGPTEERPRVVLTGDLSGLPLADLVGFFNQTRVSGSLRIFSPSGERVLYFKNGEVRGAGSDDPADRLGEIAVRLKLVEREKVEGLVASKQSHGRVGRALIEAGLLRPHDLWRCLQSQVSEIFHSVLLSHEGHWVLVDEEIEEQHVRLGLNTQGLLMDSIRRIDEMKEFRKRIPSPRTYLFHTGRAPQELEKDERILFDLCTGNRTVSEIIQSARITEFDATKILYRLVEGGYLSSSPNAINPGQGRPPPSVEEVVSVFNLIFQLIIGEVKRVNMVAEFVAAANAALAQQSEQDAILAGVGFGNDGTLVRQQVNAAIARSGMPMQQAAKALYAGLSEIVFFLFFEVSELLKTDVDEELNRRVKSLLTSLESD